MHSEVLEAAASGCDAASFTKTMLGLVCQQALGSLANSRSVSRVGSYDVATYRNQVFDLDKIGRCRVGQLGGGRCSAGWRRLFDKPSAVP